MKKVIVHLWRRNVLPKLVDVGAFCSSVRSRSVDSSPVLVYPEKLAVQRPRHGVDQSGCYAKRSQAFL